MLHSKWDRPKYDISIKTQEELYKKRSRYSIFRTESERERSVVCRGRRLASKSDCHEISWSAKTVVPSLTTLESFVLLLTGARNRAQCQKWEYIQLGIGIFCLKCTGKLCISFDYIAGSVSVMFLASVFHVKAKLTHNRTTSKSVNSTF